MPTILKPGIIVVLTTSVKGGVHYHREEIEAEHTNGGGESVAKWKTERRIDNPDEFKRASDARSAARKIIEKLCTNTILGLHCATGRVPELDPAIEQAKLLCDAHNVGAQSTRVELFAFPVEIAKSEAEAAKAVASQVEGLLGRMAQGIRAGDVEATRSAATELKQVSGALSDDAAARVQVGIEAARKAARELTKAAKDGEAPANLAPQLAAVEMSRFAFLDVDAPVGAGVVAAAAARNLEV